MVRQWVIGPVFVALAAPALAQDGSGSVDEGFDLLREGARILMESMLKEMEPALRDMQDDLGAALKEMEPALRELGAMIGDLRNYHAPERLPNGDIIIRRKTPAELLTERGDDIEL
jgi:hypothetical protein